MKISTIRTEKITTSSLTLEELLDTYITSLDEGSIVAITSKVVSLCEGSVVGVAEQSKGTLVERQSQYYLSEALSKYSFSFTITNNTLIPMAGIDESNADGHYVLWPKDAQKTANHTRHYLAKKFNLQKVGVIITDSTCQPLRRGTSGIALAHSGFRALRDYVGMKDLFGRPYKVTQANISGGLAAAAVFAMGEGNEQTPICIASDLSSVEFQPADPTRKELYELRIDMHEDLFAPFLESVTWEKGQKWTQD
jgi:putative folate metabolism gamma-glutamate ligase